MAGSSQAGNMTSLDYHKTQRKNNTDRQTFYIIVFPFPSVQFDNICTCEHPAIINDTGDKVLNSLPNGSCCLFLPTLEFISARGILGFELCYCLYIKEGILAINCRVWE